MIVRRFKNQIKHNWKTPKRLPSNYTKRIIFGGCGNLLIYQLGVMKFIVHHFGKRRFRSQCTFEGLSGGSATAGYSIVSCYDCYDFDYWYENGSSGPAKSASIKPFGMLWTTSDEVSKLAAYYGRTIQNWHQNQSQPRPQINFDDILDTENHDDNEENQFESEPNQVPEWMSNDQYITWVTAVSGDEFGANKLFSQKTTKNDISESMSNLLKATSYIPFILSTWFYCYVGDIKCIDGCVAMFIGDQSIFEAKSSDGKDCEILYVNCDLHANRKNHRKRLENGNVIYYLDIWKWADINMTDVIVWGDSKPAEDLYQKGYNAAKKNEKFLDQVLNEFFA